MNIINRKRELMGYLTICNKRYPVYEGLNTIGRNKDAIIILKDHGISQHHSVITIVNDSEHYISDFKSSNGTYLNSQKLRPYCLNQIYNNSKIQFSNNILGTYTKISKNSIVDDINFHETQSIDDTNYAANTQIFNDTEDNLRNSTNISTSSQINIHDLQTQISFSKPSTSKQTNECELTIPDDGLDISLAEAQDKLDMRSLTINEMATQIISPNTSNNEDINIHDQPTQAVDLKSTDLSPNNINTLLKLAQVNTKSPVNIHDAVTPINSPIAALHSAPTQLICADDITNFEVTTPSLVNKNDSEKSQAKSIKLNVAENITQINNSGSDTEENSFDLHTAVTPLSSPVLASKPNIHINKISSGSDTEVEDINKENVTNIEANTSGLQDEFDTSSQIITTKKNKSRVIASDSDTDLDIDTARKLSRKNQIKSQLNDSSASDTDFEESLITKKNASKKVVKKSSRIRIGDKSRNDNKTINEVDDEKSKNVIRKSGRIRKRSTRLNYDLIDHSKRGKDLLNESSSDDNALINKSQKFIGIVPEIVESNKISDCDSDASNSIHKRPIKSKKVDITSDVENISNSDDEPSLSLNNKSPKLSIKRINEGSRADESTNDSIDYATVNVLANPEEIAQVRFDCSLLHTSQLNRNSRSVIDSDLDEESMVDTTNLEISVDVIIPCTQDVCNINKATELKSCSEESFKLGLSEYMDETTNCTIHTSQIASTSACTFNNATKKADNSDSNDTIDFDFNAPTQKIMHSTKLSLGVTQQSEHDSDEFDFDAPTQKILLDSSKNNESKRDVFEMATQIDEKLVVIDDDDDDTQTMDDLENDKIQSDAIFEMPTQKVSANSSNIIDSKRDEVFEIATQVEEKLDVIDDDDDTQTMDDLENKKIHSDAIFEMPTQKVLANSSKIIDSKRDDIFEIATQVEEKLDDDTQKLTIFEKPTQKVLANSSKIIDSKRDEVFEITTQVADKFDDTQNLKNFERSTKKAIQVADKFDDTQNLTHFEKPTQKANSSKIIYCKRDDIFEMATQVTPIQKEFDSPKNNELNKIEDDNDRSIGDSIFEMATQKYNETNRSFGEISDNNESRNEGDSIFELATQKINNNDSNCNTDLDESDSVFVAATQEDCAEHEIIKPRTSLKKRVTFGKLIENSSDEEIDTTKLQKDTNIIEKAMNILDVSNEDKSENIDDIAKTANIKDAEEVIEDVVKDVEDIANIKETTDYKIKCVKDTTEIKNIDDDLETVIEVTNSKEIANVIELQINNDKVDNLGDLKEPNCDENKSIETMDHGDSNTKKVTLLNVPKKGVAINSDDIESQLEVMFATQSFVSDSNSSRPSNPLAQILGLPTQDVLADDTLLTKKRRSSETDFTDYDSKRSKTESTVIPGQVSNKLTRRKSVSQDVLEDAVVSRVTNRKTITDYFKQDVGSPSSLNRPSIVASPRKFKLSINKIAIENKINKNLTDDEEIPNDTDVAITNEVILDKKVETQKPLRRTRRNTIDEGPKLCAIDESKQLIITKKTRRPTIDESNIQIETKIIKNTRATRSKDVIIIDEPKNNRKLKPKSRAGSASDSEEKFIMYVPNKPKRYEIKETVDASTSKIVKPPAKRGRKLKNDSETDDSNKSSEKVNPIEKIPAKRGRPKKIPAKISSPSDSEVSIITVSDASEIITSKRANNVRSIEKPTTSLNIISKRGGKSKAAAPVVGSDSEVSTISSTVSSPKRRKCSEIDSSALLSTPERAKRQLKPKIVFTMLDSPQLETLIRFLGGSIVESVESCTVLVTKKILRSQKLLSAVGQGKPICTPDWLHACKIANKFLDPWDYLISDAQAEKKWNFSLKESYNRSRALKLYEGYTFQLIITNAIDVVKGAIESCGGKCVSRAPKDTTNFIVVSVQENKSKYAKFIKQNIMVVASEAIFDGVLRQEIIFNEHLLE